MKIVDRIVELSDCVLVSAVEPGTVVRGSGDRKLYLVALLSDDDGAIVKRAVDLVTGQLHKHSGNWMVIIERSAVLTVRL